MRAMKFAAMAVLAVSMLGGCVIRPAVAIGPGYYYDDAYYDVYGIYHPRVYWYYDGYRWAHRPWLPRGYFVRPRGYYHYR